jgi:hypothetical protein
MADSTSKHPVRKLTTTEALFRLSLTARRDPAIDAWLNQRTPELGAIAREWFLRMRECGDNVRETMHDGCPVACVEDAPFGYVNVFSSHVNVGFFLGAELDDPAGLLQGTGRRMRHVKVRPGSDLDDTALSALIQGAYEEARWRLATE